jgi:hypothetical protein
MPAGTIGRIFQGSKEKVHYVPPREFRVCFCLAENLPLTELRDCYHAVTVAGDENSLHLKYHYRNPGLYDPEKSKFSGVLRFSKDKNGNCVGKGSSRWHGEKVSLENRFWETNLDATKPCKNWEIEEGYYEVLTTTSFQGKFGVFTLTPFDFSR